MMAFKKKDKQSSLATLLPSIMRDRGWMKQLDLHSIFPKWKELVGEDLANYAKPLKIERGVLWIEVENSAWLQQFQYEKIDLLDLLNTHLQIGKLSGVRMVLPKGKSKKGDSGDREADNRVTFVKPDEKSIAAFQRQVESIQDEKCRDSLMSFWYLSHACKRKEE